MIKAAAKQAVFIALGSVPALSLKLRALRKANAVTILNLHRVGPPDGSTYPPLSPHLFDYLLGFVRRHFDIITFDDVAGNVGRERPRLVLSFDDGYADFATHALPLLEKHGIRANQNIIPQCVDSGLPPLNVLMADYVGRAPAEELRRLEVPDFPLNATSLLRTRYGNLLSAFIKGKPITEQRRLAEALLPQVRRLKSFKPTAMMTLEQVRRVAKSQDIGAHSFAHASLGLESDDYLRDDVRKCRKWFEANLSAPITTYAFPNGSYRPDQVEIVRLAGIEHVLLVEEDFSTPGSAVHKRFTFDATSRAEARFRATGGFRWPQRHR